MLSTSVFDDEGVLTSSDIIVDAPVTFRGPTGLDLFGYDPVEGLVDANGNPITGGGGTPGGSDTQLQYNNNNAFGGMNVTRDAASGGLRFQGQPIVFGFADTANDGEPALGVLSSGSEVGLALMSSFTDTDHWTGLTFYLPAPTSAWIGPQINGSSSTTTLTIQSGSGGFNLFTLSGGVLRLAPDGNLTLESNSGLVNLKQDMFVDNGKAIKGDTTTAHTWSLNAYDVDGAATQKMIEFTNANEPLVNITAPTGLLFNSSVKAIGFTNNDDGEPSLFFKNASGAAVSVMIGPTFTSPSAWEGLKILSYADTVLMCAEKNGNPNNGVMFIKANILNLSTANGVACDHDITFSNGTGIKTTTTDANTLLIQAYDMDGAARVTFGTLTNGNTPSCNWIAPTGTTMILQPTTYKSADGTTGLATFSGPVTNITVKNGLITAAS